MFISENKFYTREGKALTSFPVLVLASSIFALWLIAAENIKQQDKPHSR
jgi:hypothetical protein